MSSLTKTEFAAELQFRSPILNDFNSSDVESYIDIALRAFSQRRPYRQTEADVAVVADQEFYDFPTDAMRIEHVVNSADQAAIHFVVVDEAQGDGQQIRLGTIKARSTYQLMNAGYYRDPASFRNEAVIATYSTFDIIYTVLQDMSSIKDDWLEALSWHVIYSASTSKAETAALAVASGAQEEAASITDLDATGASTTIKFQTSVDTAKTYTAKAKEALAQFKTLTKRTGFGVRG